MLEGGTIVAALGVILNLIALLIAVSRILSQSSQQITTMEVRNAERFTRMEVKMERVEKDIQNFYGWQRDKPPEA